jgi:hypothetical protein
MTRPISWCRIQFPLHFSGLFQWISFLGHFRTSIQNVKITVCPTGKNWRASHPSCQSKWSAMTCWDFVMVTFSFGVTYWCITQYTVQHCVWDMYHFKFIISMCLVWEGANLSVCHIVVTLSKQEQNNSIWMDCDYKVCRAIKFIHVWLINHTIFLCNM